MKRLLFTVIASLSVALSPCWGEGISKKDNNSMLANGLKFLGVPYVAHTLEVNSPKETLVLNQKQLDCTTFVENALARSLCKNPDNLTEFAANLTKIRYRNGIINGYPSRLHYSTEWVMNGVKNGYLVDEAAIHSKDTLTVHVSFMSTHVSSYPQLACSADNVAAITRKEKELTGTVAHYVPVAKLPVKGLKWIHNGDIILLVTNMKGLDNSHLGIAIYQKGELHLLHASSADKKVKIQEEPLCQQLAKRKGCLGIRVVRMKK
jgi:hypothetical protein